MILHIDEQFRFLLQRNTRRVKRTYLLFILLHFPVIITNKNVMIALVLSILTHNLIKIGILGYELIEKK